MTEPFKTKRRGELLGYTRPNIGRYEDESGDIQTSPNNVPRFEYKDGYPYGLKMGDGDRAVIPTLTNDEWPSTMGTFVVTYNAPVGVKFIECGNVEFVGYGVMKTVIKKLTPPDSLSNEVVVSPDSVDLPDDSEAHLLILKHYAEDVDFGQYTEYEAMEELNTFMHAAWN